MNIASISSAFPEHYYSQEALFAKLLARWGHVPEARERLSSFNARTGVAGRHLALPEAEYDRLGDFTAKNREYVRVAVELGERALARALDDAGVRARDLDHLFFVSVTGVATPSIDARLVNRLRLNPHLRRTPIFGLGCVAGAAGLARAADWVRAYPAGTAALLAVELCSLTWQPDDISVPNLLASSLFGDGAAAVVLRGQQHERRGPRIVGSRSVFYPNTERVMGWEIGSRGLEIVLSPEVPELVSTHAARDVDAFLAEFDLTRTDVTHWVLHTGGPKVLEAFQRALGLSAEDLALSWKQLRDNGNVSSASVLLVLADTWRERRPPAGSRSLLMAMGPGFCSELLLLEW